MDGRAFSDAIAKVFIAIVIGVLGGAVIGIGLWLLVPWLLHHVSILFH